MQSKNKLAPTKAEAAHIERVKSLPCVVCWAPPPSECHEIEQGLWWASVPLCASCHRDNFNGVHGQQRIWKVKKMTELVALNATIRELFSNG